MLTMRYYHKFAIIGFAIGFFAIISGVIALTTPVWISITYKGLVHPIIYSLFQQCKTNETSVCTHIQSFGKPQYFEIIGYVILVIGLVFGVLCTAFIDKRSIHFIPPIILLVGVKIILFGFMFYVEYVIEIYPMFSIERINLGYSMILMICTCMIGCVLTAYFSFTAGYIHRHILATVNIY